jgi:hypothetical protein
MKLQIAVSLLLMLLCSIPASAQSSTGAASLAPTTDHVLKIPVLVWAAAAAADQITTYQFSSEYRDMMHEENPLIRGLDRRPTLLVAAGTAIDAATGWLAYRLLSGHPRLAQVAFYSAAAYRGYLAAHNAQMMRRADALRSLSALSTPKP